MAKSTVESLRQLIGELQAERRDHEQAIEEIDRTFASLGIEPGTKVSRRRGRPPKSAVAAAPASGGSKKKGRRKRRTFKVSGEQAVLDFVKKTGKPSTAQINDRWESMGRSGKADNTLTKLVQAGKLKRIKDPGVRGSRYQAV